MPPLGPPSELSVTLATQVTDMKEYAPEKVEGPLFECIIPGAILPVHLCVAYV